MTGPLTPHSVRFRACAYAIVSFLAAALAEWQSLAGEMQFKRLHGEPVYLAVPRDFGSVPPEPNMAVFGSLGRQWAERWGQERLVIFHCRLLPVLFDSSLGRFPQLIATELHDRVSELADRGQRVSIACVLMHADAFVLAAPMPPIDELVQRINFGIVHDVNRQHRVVTVFVTQLDRGPGKLAGFAPSSPRRTGSSAGESRAASGAEGMSTSDSYEAALEGLRSNEAHRIMAACAYLTRHMPEKGQLASVVARLHELLQHENLAVQIAALEATTVWYNEETPRYVVRCLKNPATRTQAAMVLALIGTPEAIQRLADQLDARDPLVRRVVAEALLIVGPAAEEYVWPYLSRGSAPIRILACQILQRIGTGRSLDTLNRVARTARSPQLRRAAELAIAAITSNRERLSAGSDSGQTEPPTPASQPEDAAAGHALSPP